MATNHTTRNEIQQLVQTSERKRLLRSRLFDYICMFLIWMIIGAGLCVLLGGWTPARATEDWCAVVTKTPDGFLNLREGPGVQFRVRGKLRPGDILQVDTASCFKSYAGPGPNARFTCAERGDWTHVVEAGRAHLFNGWISTKWIKQVSCEGGVR